MPAIVAQYPAPNSPAARALDDAGDSERKTRKTEIDRFWQYYKGDHDKPLKIKPGKRDDNVIVNLCGQAIDKAVDFFAAPRVPTITAPGEAPPDGGVSPAQQALDRFWHINDLNKFLSLSALSGFISGHNFAKLIMAGNEPLVALLDARLVSVFWDIGFSQAPLFYRVQWKVAEDHMRRQDIVPDWLLSDTPQRDTASHWTIIEYEQKRTTGGTWAEVGRDAWAFPFAPIVDWANMALPFEYYGLSDLRHLSLNDSVNFVASNTARIIKSHAHPKTFLFGAKLGENAAQSIEGVWELPGEARVENLEMQGDLASSMNMLAALRAAFFSQMRVVDWAVQKDKIGQLTNFGLRVLFSDMLAQTQNKREMYGAYGLAEISRRALAMRGFEVPQRPTVQWVDPLPSNRTEEVQAVEVEQRLGFTSNHTLAAALGRDYATERDLRAEEATSAGDVFADLMMSINQAGALT